MTLESGEKRDTVLSQRALVEMQKIEAIPVAEERAPNMHQEIPDMGVGWYVTPQETDHSND